MWDFVIDFVVDFVNYLWRGDERRMNQSFMIRVLLSIEAFYLVLGIFVGSTVLGNKIL